MIREWNWDLSFNSVIHFVIFVLACIETNRLKPRLSELLKVVVEMREQQELLMKDHEELKQIVLKNRAVGREGEGADMA